MWLPNRVAPLLLYGLGVDALIRSLKEIKGFRVWNSGLAGSWETHVAETCRVQEFGQGCAIIHPMMIAAPHQGFSEPTG